MVPTYSTVANYFDNTVFDSQRWFKISTKQLNLSFTLNIKSQSLSHLHHYNSYQQQLYNEIKRLKEVVGLGYRRISHILYNKGYRTLRNNKPILNNYVYAIYSKGKIREERLNRSFNTQILDLKYSISAI